MSHLILLAAIVLVISSPTEAYRRNYVRKIIKDEFVEPKTTTPSIFNDESKSETSTAAPPLKPGGPPIPIFGVQTLTHQPQSSQVNQQAPPMYPQYNPYPYIAPPNYQPPYFHNGAAPPFYLNRAPWNIFSEVQNDLDSNVETTNVAPNTPYMAGNHPYLISNTPYVAGNAPYNAGNAPYNAGNAPYVAGNTPYVAGNTPYNAGNTPYNAGNTPYVAGNTPYIAGNIPYVAPNIPYYLNRQPWEIFSEVKNGLDSILEPPNVAQNFYDSNLEGAIPAPNFTKEELTLLAQIVEEYRSSKLTTTAQPTKQNFEVSPTDSKALIANSQLDLDFEKLFNQKVHQANSEKDRVVGESENMENILSKLEPYDVTQISYKPFFPSGPTPKTFRKPSGNPKQDVEMVRSEDDFRKYVDKEGRSCVEKIVKNFEKTYRLITCESNGYDVEEQKSESKGLPEKGALIFKDELPTVQEKDIPKYRSPTSYLDLRSRNV